MKKYFENVWYCLSQLFIALFALIIGTVYNILLLILFPFYFIISFSWEQESAARAIERYGDYIVDYLNKS